MHLNIYIFFISPYKPMPIKMKNCTIENSKSEKLLDITFGLNLSFDNNMTYLYGKTNQKIPVH